jgi:site-specific recombinase XerD
VAADKLILRHSQATILLIAGENPKVVSERLGHSTVKHTLDTYSHVLPTMQERTTEKLETMLYGVTEGEEEKLKTG